jgi:hypothetical protein
MLLAVPCRRLEQLPHKYLTTFPLSYLRKSSPWGLKG